MPRLAALAALACLLASITIQAAAPPAASAAASAPAAADRLQTLLEQTARQRDVCAAALAVIRQRKVERILTTPGCKGAPPLNGDSLFQAASLSKPLFAYGVLKLVAQGKLALDAPIMRYLPEGYVRRLNPFAADGPTERVSDPQLAAVTVRMALSHRSGLPLWARGPLTFSAAPGSGWRYSGEGYVLLQRAVERITGQPLDQWMAGQVLPSLGMLHSSFVWQPQLDATLQAGQAADGSPRGVVQAVPLAAGTLYTSASDYARFLATLLNDADTLARISDAPGRVDDTLGLSWGQGWGIEKTAHASYLWQPGNNPGYRAFVMLAPASGDGFVLLTNSENGLRLVEPLANHILPDTHRVFDFWMLR
ncbi:CubicO group peptidase, beta-lactamase class C family [Andreprevotia lacus DSM 23236]|jgi:CubicO group peptidase (beta-lactamase class C family)|uniref:CubicO group peptidase, beta-lactamase class C family n=1 Tax=Andreprevotia lacus DSM 23236 TaxID=1121001 RepID=A0A1W1XYX5_9NEIS|nr:serine hydrolase domain-containing protein [Andreprevotia lacus]SMC29113.1 CubicO group peptidase, beta-lactamase class C family [Andreprevotia lacus DSM 23236]